VGHSEEALDRHAAERLCAQVQVAEALQKIVVGGLVLELRDVLFYAPAALAQVSLVGGQHEGPFRAWAS
jgi:hypothetical protein